MAGEAPSTIPFMRTIIIRSHSPGYGHIESYNSSVGGPIPSRLRVLKLLMSSPVTRLDYFLSDELRRIEPEQGYPCKNIVERLAPPPVRTAQNGLVLPIARRAGKGIQGALLIKM